MIWALLASRSLYPYHFFFFFFFEGYSFGCGENAGIGGPKLARDILLGENEMFGCIIFQKQILFVTTSGVMGPWGGQIWKEGMSRCNVLNLLVDWDEAVKLGMWEWNKKFVC